MLDKVLQVFNSPTLMTMGGILARVLSLVVVLPIVLKSFPTDDINLWFLFSIVIGLQSIFDVGFSPTFSRVIAYAFAGVKSIEEKPSEQNPSDTSPNVELIQKIYATMKRVYLYLNIFSVSLLIIFGTLSLRGAINSTSNSTESWIAWGVILFVSFFYIRGNTYVSFLLGLNKVAILRKWEMWFSLIGIITSLLAIYLDTGILGLVSVNQFWILANIVRNRYLAMYYSNHYSLNIQRVKGLGIDRFIFRSIFHRAWKSGLGVIFSYGVTQSTGLIYANYGTPQSLGSYLISLRILNVISEFSRSPFYSQLPQFSMWYAQNKTSTLVKHGKSAMIKSVWLFTILALAGGALGNPILKLIGSNINKIDVFLWSLLSLGVFAERYGALHIQLYSCSNKIIWHIANSINGIIFILISVFLLKNLDVYAFAAAYIVSYWCFYIWYTTWHSYKEFKLSFLAFDAKIGVGPLLIFVVYIILNLP